MTKTLLRNKPKGSALKGKRGKKFKYHLWAVVGPYGVVDFNLYLSKGFAEQVGQNTYGTNKIKFSICKVEVREI